MLLILGVRTRVVALALIPVLLGATWVHAGNGWLFTSPNGGWEYPAFWTVALVVQALLGDGALRAASRQTRRGSRNAPEPGALPALTPGARRTESRKTKETP